MKFRLSIACTLGLAIAGCSSELPSTSKAPAAATAPRANRTRRVPVPTVAPGEETSAAESPSADTPAAPSESSPAAGTTGSTGPSSPAAAQPSSTALNPVAPRPRPRRTPPVVVAPAPEPVATRRPIPGFPQFTAIVTDAEAASVARALDTMIDVAALDGSGAVRNAMMDVCAGIAGNGRGCAAEVLSCLQTVSANAEASASSYFGQMVGTLRAYGEASGMGPDFYSTDGMDYRTRGWSDAVARVHAEIASECADAEDGIESECTAALRALSGYMGAASRASWARHGRQQAASIAGLPDSLRFSSR